MASALTMAICRPNDIYLILLYLVSFTNPVSLAENHHSGSIAPVCKRNHMASLS
jgi:hypothetical protein